MWESLANMGTSLKSGLGDLTQGLMGTGQQPFNLATDGGLTGGLAGAGQEAIDLALGKKQLFDAMQGSADPSMFDMFSKGASMYGDINKTLQGNKLFDKNMQMFDQQYKANEESLAKRRASDKSLAGAFGTDYWADRPQ